MNIFTSSFAKAKNLDESKRIVFFIVGCFFCCLSLFLFSLCRGLAFFVFLRVIIAFGVFIVHCRVGFLFASSSRVGLSRRLAVIIAYFFGCFLSTFRLFLSTFAGFLSTYSLVFSCIYQDFFVSL